MSDATITYAQGATRPCIHLGCTGTQAYVADVYGTSMVSRQWFCRTCKRTDNEPGWERDYAEPHKPPPGVDGAPGWVWSEREGRWVWGWRVAMKEDQT